MANGSMSQERQEHVNSFIGKTVESFDCACTNNWIIYFTDGTHLEISVEASGVPDLNALVPVHDGRAKMRQFMSAGTR